MSLRLRLIGIKSPHNIMRTIHRDTTFNASELKHLIPKEHLHALFPRGAGINFDFSDRGKIILRPEQHMIACINAEPMQVDHDYPLVLGDVKMLAIGKVLFRIDVFHSYF